MSLSEENNTASLVPINNNANLSSILISWIGTTTHYSAINKFLEEEYRSPSNLHDAHHQAIRYINSIRKELRIIAQATQRLSKKEELISGLIEEIGNPYEKSISNEQQYNLDAEIERTFSNMKIDSYSEISNSVELICEYIMEKMYLSFIEEVEPKTKNNNNNIDIHPFFNVSKNIESLEEIIPKELCQSIYNDYMSVKDLPLPALEAFLYVDSKMIEEKLITELKIFGSFKSKESFIINLWKCSKVQYKMWISSMCGKVLGYYTIIGQQEKVTKILSRITKS